MAEYHFKAVLERDIDLMIIEEFCSDPSFADIFLCKISLNGAEIIEACHSVVDILDGESDIVFYVKKENAVTAIMIEDKICADAMPAQCERYFIRGKKLVETGKASDYRVFIVAPKKYLETNSEAKLYPLSVSYEELIDFYKNRDDLHAEYKSALLKKAVSDCSLGYVPVADSSVTEFWKNYYQYQKKNFPMLSIKEKSGPRGSSAHWAWFKSCDNKIPIIHKANLGFVDLSFSNSGKKNVEFNNVLSLFPLQNRLIRKTGKSTSIRLIVPVLDFHSDFRRQEAAVKECLSAVSSLSTLAEMIYCHNLGIEYFEHTK